MILIYTALLLLLGTVKILVSLRARGLERKYVRVAAEVERLLREADFKPGNSGKVALCVSAKRTVVLGELVQERDRVEATYFAWQRRADRLGNWVGAARAMKGKKLPYTLGAVDVWMLLSVVDYLGVGQYVSAIALIELMVAWWNQ